MLQIIHNHKSEKTLKFIMTSENKEHNTKFFKFRHNSVEIKENYSHKNFVKLNFIVTKNQLISRHTVWKNENFSHIVKIQGDPNQNFPFLRAISLKVCTSDPMLVKPKLV